MSVPYLVIRSRYRFEKLRVTVNVRDVDFSQGLCILARVDT